MKYVILCGGLGNRVSNSVLYSKPLNLVNGVHSICYCLESIPYDELYFVLNKKLAEYNFETLLTHMGIHKKIHYVYLDVDTRGPVETAYLGLKQFNFDPDEQVCFIDNDTIYDLNNISFPEGNFMCYCTIIGDNTNKPYCFIKHENHRLVDLCEKKVVSNTYSCGIYGFESVNFFMKTSHDLLFSEMIGEYFFSTLYKQILQDNNTVNCVEMNNCVCIGTFEDIQSNLSVLPFKKRRFCFDIDNTLLKYRIGEQTYRDCETIDKNVFLLKKIKEMGHTIILYTARGMKTSGGNVGKLMQRVAKDTFDSLEKLGIEYDEIYFGKPEADFYIDDKAYNPYLNIFDALGFSYLNEEYAKTKINGNSANKFNCLYKVENIITKCGASDSMKGEVYFYETIKDTDISKYFPTFNSYEEEKDVIKIKLEYIHGFTFFDLLKNGLFSKNHLELMTYSLHLIHLYYDIPITITKQDIYDNYMKKLEERSQNHHNYPFENTRDIIVIINDKIKKYLFNDSTKIAPVVHGDSWFSNTILGIRNNIKFLDMKGNINGILTTNGDPLTDFGKMLQSLLGFDYIVNNIESYDDACLTDLRRCFLEIMIKKYNLQDIYAVTACLIAKTFYFLDVDIQVRGKLWSIVEKLCTSEDIF